MTEGENVSLTPADVWIIRCLQSDARTPVTEIATRIKTPESTVRHRLNRLIQKRIIDLTAVANPLKLGYRLWVVIQIQAELSKIRSVAQRLASTQEVNFVGITTGSYDILAAAFFRSNDELLDFITVRLPAIPGIIRTSTSSMLELLKRSMTLTLPADYVANGKPLRRTPRLQRPRRKLASG